VKSSKTRTRSEAPSPMTALTRRSSPARAVDILIEDVAVLEAHPDQRAVRAVPQKDGVVLFSTDEEALDRVVEVLRKPGFGIRARKINLPSADVLDLLLEGSDVRLLPAEDEADR
jgi:hypothetical protein